MNFAVITLFPELLEAFLGTGVIGRAVKDELLNVELINPREYTTDVHRTVDDRPFGGGPGMVMKAEPLIESIAAAKKTMPECRTVYLSPQGQPLTQKRLREWRQESAIVLIAGRYEGIDERVIAEHVDDEVSIGDYVLSGGEVAAMVVIDALGRLVPGVLGSPESADEDSFGEDGLLDHPHYTRPEQLGEHAVPPVLLSGDHAAIASWRRQMALTRTWQRRPELLATANLTGADRVFLNKLTMTDSNAGQTPGKKESDDVRDD